MVWEVSKKRWLSDESFFKKKKIELDTDLGGDSLINPFCVQCVQNVQNSL